MKGFILPLSFLGTPDLMKDMKGKIVVVFGIFDGVHFGHEAFFQQAKKYGKVVAIVGRDVQAREHKGKAPTLNERQRLGRVVRHPYVYRALLGDKKSGEYRIFSKVKPDVICLGYDQKALQKDLKRWMKERKVFIPIFILKAHKSHLYHSSLLH